MKYAILVAVKAAVMGPTKIKHEYKTGTKIFAIEVIWNYNITCFQNHIPFIEV